uniref:Phospholipase A(2) n=1 Tax=Heterorhabditis bacteriophora TaxID=37862 RepID=A0A1I7X0J1_HETBA
MLVSYVLIFICVPILPTATSHLNFIDWQCGSEDLSRQVAYESVMDHCPEFAPQMNHCCAVHDDCYTHQLGQKKCDADFCECSLRVTNESKAGACKPIVDISCELMDWVGWYAYANSVNYTGLQRFQTDGYRHGSNARELPKNSPSDSSHEGYSWVLTSLLFSLSALTGLKDGIILLKSEANSCIMWEIRD